MITKRPIVRVVPVRLPVVGAWVVALTCFGAAAPQNPASDGDLRVDVRSDAGQLRGVRDPTGVMVFRGIPFAAPPVGDARWQPPKPLQARTGVRQATTFGARCPQQGGEAGAGAGALPTSEDCLFLNVWTTAIDGDARRPVLVWFHGGGGVGGTAANPTLDGKALAQKGLVVITVNYRLGLLGYLAHPALSAESRRRVSGNYALLDQIAALQWVQRNIATFGGDQSRVTAAGSSAGARGVATLLVSPMSKGLFHRAILQSGTGLDDAVELLTAAEAHGVRVAEMMGVRGTGPDAAAALRALAPATLVSTFARWRSVIEGPPAPTIARSAVDGWAIPQAIDQSLQHGTMHQVPLLLGTSADEGTAAIREVPFGSVDEFHAALRRWYGDEDGALARAYPVAATGRLLPTFQRLWGDEKYGAPARAFARLAAARGARVYFYFFSRVGAGMEARGAFHGSDVSFAFGQPTRNAAAETTPFDETLTRVMSEYWAAFAANGDPNGGGRPVWPRFDPKSDEYLELGATIAAGRGLRTAQWDAIDGVARRRGAFRP